MSQPIQSGIPKFATNEPEGTENVGQAISRLFHNASDGLVERPSLAIATAYINPPGFVILADELEAAPRVRLLLGAEPEEPFRQRIERERTVDFEEVAEDHLRDLEIDRDFLGFDTQTDAACRRLVQWLRSSGSSGTPKVEVRRFTRGFLHGKAYIVEHPHMPAVLAGSSNLTRAGLAWNRELNLGWGSSHETDNVMGWFDKIWNESEPFDLAAIYEARWKEHSPGIVFLRMLYELYGIEDDTRAARPQLEVTEFQADGIRRAQRILDDLGGVLVCDEVGLGKTFIAGEIIKQIAERDRQSVLIVVPAALKTSTWIPFLERYDFPRRVRVATYEEVRNGSADGVRPEQLDDYALVVIDEAHNLRNPAARRSEAIMNLLTGSHRKKVVLLTATPVNNSLKDLQTLISYFVPNDGHFVSIGIPSISEYISGAQRMDIETLSPEHLFDLMDKVAVRRTRRFIKEAYPHTTLKGLRGEDIPVEFPDPRVKRVDYQLDEGASRIVDEVIYALEISSDEQLVIRAGKDRDSRRLSLARYAPSVYRHDAEVENYQINNVGLLRSTLLKRLESSTAALESTLNRLISSHENFLAALADGFVLSGDALRDYSNSDAESLEEFLESLDSENDQVEPIDRYAIDDLRNDVEGDLVLLRRFQELAAARLAEGPDDKVLKLADDLEEIAKEAERPDKNGVSSGDRRKVILFSTFAETARSVHEQISALIAQAPTDSPLAAYKERIAPAVFGSSGGGSQDERAGVLAGFAPATAGEVSEEGTLRSLDQFDLLITTDVLAEGVNLQQAGRMINYDLPWNPMRLVQRHGRIDRIGSHHRFVHIDCFFPAQNLDSMLRLEEKLQRKIALANAAIGVGNVIPGQIADASVEVIYRDTEREIKTLLDEDPSIFLSRGGSEALSGEEYRHRLADSFKRKTVKAEVLGLPFGSGSGFESSTINFPGYVFCIRIGDEQRPWFRFVPVDTSTWKPVQIDTGEPIIYHDTLTCLMAADPGTIEGDQYISEVAAAGVFEAWRVAREDVFEKWTHLTDRANLEPKLKKALRDASDLVAREGNFLGPDGQSGLMGQLSGRWKSGIVNEVRAIVRDTSKSDKAKINALKTLAEAEGLVAPERPTPLQPVTREDIRVVCWMAISPKQPRSESLVDLLS